MSRNMNIEMEPIGFVRTDAEKIPRHWSISDEEGTLVIAEHNRFIDFFTLQGYR